MRAPVAQRVRARLTLGALLLALVGCFDTAPQVVELAVPVLEMNGFTRSSVTVTAPGAWTMDVLPVDPTVRGAITLSRSGGTDSMSVDVNVDATAMPRIDQAFQLRLVAKVRGGEVVRTSDTVTFSYPDVVGTVAVVPEGAAGPLGVGYAAARGGTDARGRVAALGGANADDLDAPLDPTAPTTTLIVGLEPRGVVLSQDGRVAGSPASPALAVATALADMGFGGAGTDAFEGANLTLVEVPTRAAAAAAAALRATPGVSYVEFPRPLYPASNDPYRHEQWNLDELAVEPLWYSASGAGTTIAVIDSGFFPAHPDLFANVVGTYDAVTGGSSVTFTNCGAHGTHVAGIAAAVANNGEGVAGVAPHAKLLLVNVGNAAQANCAMNTAWLIKALEYVTNGGDPRAQVVNMSLGDASGADLGSGVRAAIQATAAAGVSLVAAAGNTASGACPSGFTTQPIMYPARYPQVLAVAATRPGMTRACYSHAGPEMFVAAPGGAGPGAPGDVDQQVLSTVAGDGYGVMAGTSMASPAVAAVIAMLRGAVPSASASQVADAIADTALDLGDPGRDSWYGYGFVDAQGAYTQLVGEPPEPPEPVTGLLLRVPGYPDALLDADLAFTLLEAAPGPLVVEVGSDDNGNGTLGEPGEWYGTATLTVRFGLTGPDPANRVTVTVARVP